MEGTIIFIGGGPTVGKTTVAKLLSKRLNIPWISTDMVRELMLGTVRKEDYKNLFKFKGFTAEKYLNTFSVEEIIQDQNDESEDVWKGIKALIEESYPWKSFIVEGVAILPYLVKKDFGERKNIKTIFLVDEDADKIKDVVWKRGLWDAAKTYPDNLKAKEVEWAQAFSKKLKKEAEKYGYSYIEVRKDDSDLDLIIKILSI